jgi:UDP-2-acetamido-3-amino-2,3-dideoxy-glucuronate N-acetyltransferase
MQASDSAAANLPAPFVHESSYADEGVQLGPGTKVWHFCHLMPGAVLGERCNLGQNVFVGKNVQLGSNVKVQNNVAIYEGVYIESDVFLGPSMVFTNVYNPRAAVNRRGEYTPTYVRRGATIGANATIICGVELGAWCFIGAGAVINRDVPPYALMVGVPARQLGWMSRYGHQLQFDGEGYATCPESGERYRRRPSGGIEWLEAE